MVEVRCCVSLAEWSDILQLGPESRKLVLEILLVPGEVKVPRVWIYGSAQLLLRSEIPLGRSMRDPEVAFEFLRSVGGGFEVLPS